MAERPRGATVVKEELNNEAGAKLREIKKTSKFAEFIAIKKKAEEESIQPLSGDYEVMEKVTPAQLKELQDARRLVGWEPSTNTALVLRLAFLDKKKKMGK
jgi:hypothetical protein